MIDHRAIVEDIFRTLPERLRPEGAAGIEAVFGFDIEGAGRFRVSVASGKASVERVSSELGSCTVLLLADAETFAGVTLGTIDASQAVMDGRLKIEGEAGLALALPRIFMKYVPRKAESASAAVTPESILTTLVSRFRPERAEGVEAAIGYDITGDGGGQWTTIVRGERITLETGLRDELTLRQTVSAKDFVDLVTGKLDPLMAIGSGRLRLHGDMDLAQRLPRLFARYQPPSAPAAEELVVLKRSISIGMRYATGPVMGRFLEGLKDRRILANVCPRCGRKQLPPREVCAECRCRAGDFVEVGPEGTLVYLDLVYYASPDPLTGKTRETPYGDIRVLLHGCKGRETFWHLLRREDLFDAHRGDRLRPVWAAERSGSIEDILCFEKIR